MYITVQCYAVQLSSDLTLHSSTAQCSNTPCHCSLFSVRLMKWIRLRALIVISDHVACNDCCAVLCCVVCVSRSSCSAAHLKESTAHHMTPSNIYLLPKHPCIITFCHFLHCSWSRLSRSSPRPPNPPHPVPPRHSAEQGPHPPCFLLSYRHSRWLLHPHGAQGSRLPQVSEGG